MPLINKCAESGYYSLVLKMMIKQGIIKY